MYQQMVGIKLPGKQAAVKIKHAKLRTRTYKLSDGYGLFLKVRPDGSKYWRLTYRFHNKQKILSLGVYPAKADSRLVEVRVCY